MTALFSQQLQLLFEQHPRVDRNNFNIFTALHKPHDERRLHSRFLSYLLSPTSNHGKGTLFLETFLTAIQCDDFNLENVIVKPNEADKREWNNLDIYIKNKEQAIIIENKIFAGDSNQLNEDGTYVPQLVKYFRKAQYDLQLNDEEKAKASIRLVYLTPYEKNPSLMQEFTRYGLQPRIVDYVQLIAGWLGDHIDKLENSLLKDSLIQYKSLVISLTNDFKLALKLKDLIADNIENAYNDNVLQEIEEFKHVKWHTIHEFWTELASKIQHTFDTELIRMPDNEDITKVAHRKSKRPLVLDFKFKNRYYYIANDSKGFTWGIVEHEEEHLTFTIPTGEHPIFSAFKNRETFNLINKGKRSTAIDSIVGELNTFLS